MKTIKRLLALSLTIALAMTMALVASAVGSTHNPVYGADDSHSIIVTFNGDTKTQRGFTWMTDTAGLDTKVQISTDTSFGTSTIVTGDASYEIDGGDRTALAYTTNANGTFLVTDPTDATHNSNIHQFVHKAVVTGLNPGTKYYYKVGSDSHWSDKGSFTTASATNGAFSFIDITDTQASLNQPTNNDYYNNFAPLLAAAAGKVPDASFVMDNGDITEKGGDLIQWECFTDAGKNQLMNTTFVPVAGNHETYQVNTASTGVNSDNYINVTNSLTTKTSAFNIAGSYLNAFVNHFNIKLPSAETNTQQGAYYSFDYNNAHIMVLNTNYLNSDGTLPDEQLNWLKSESAAAAGKWKIVSFHRTVQSEGTHIGEPDVVALRGQLLKVIASDGIDVVLQGHDHTYVRSLPIGTVGKPAAGTSTVTENFNGTNMTFDLNPKGTTYVIPGSSDDKYYTDMYDTNSNQNADQIAAAQNIYPAVHLPTTGYSTLTNPTFAGIQISGDKLVLTSYQFNISTNAVTVIDTYGIKNTNYSTTAILYDKTTVNSAIAAAVGTSVNVDVSSNPAIDASIFDTAKTNGKDVTFVSHNADGSLKYSWTFKGSDINNTSISLSTLGFSNSLSNPPAEESSLLNTYSPYVISFGYSGALPGKATIQLKVDPSWLSGKDTSHLNLYYYNPTTKKGELVQSGLTIDSSGYVTFTISHCSDYLISTRDISDTTTSVKPNPPTGDSSHAEILIIFAALLVAGCVVFGNLKLKKSA